VKRVFPSCEVLKRLIKAGEAANVEFKARAKIEDTSDMAELICAMANTGGGVVLLGVKDDGTLEGIRLTKEDSEKAKLRIVNISDHHIRPAVGLDMDVVHCSEGDVFCIGIHSSVVPCAAKRDDLWIHWWRIDSHNRQMPPERVVALSRASTSADLAKTETVQPETFSRAVTARQDPTSIEMHLEFDTYCLRKPKTITWTQRRIEYYQPKPAPLSSHTTDAELRELHESIHLGAMGYDPWTKMKPTRLAENARRWIEATYAKSIISDSRRLTDLLRVALGHFVLDQAARRRRKQSKEELFASACRSYSARGYTRVVFKETQS
jgi:hypothetical protein